MLDMAFGLTDTSRLGCQVKLTRELDGMTATLPAATRNMYVDGMCLPCNRCLQRSSYQAKSLLTLRHLEQQCRNENIYQCFLLIGVTGTPQPCSTSSIWLEFNLQSHYSSWDPRLRPFFLVS